MYKLYYSPGKANLAPHMVLEEIGAPFELIEVDTEGGEHRDVAYRKLNPNGLLPTLVDGELVLYKTAAICMHLANRHLGRYLDMPLQRPAIACAFPSESIAGQLV